NAYLLGIVPKGFFPQQDNGRLTGAIQAAQDTSFQAMQQRLHAVVGVITEDPAVGSVIGFTGGSSGPGGVATNVARLFTSLKPLGERKLTADQVIARLRPKLAAIPRARTFLQPVPDLRVAGRARNAQYMYTPLKQYHVVMEVAPRFWQRPDTLRQLYLRAPNGNPVPLSAFASYAETTTPLAVNHQSQFPSVTLSFNLAPGVSLGDAVNAIETATRPLGLPASIQGSFQGTAQAFQPSIANEPML